MPLVNVDDERYQQLLERIMAHPAFVGNLDVEVGPSANGDKLAWTAKTREGKPYAGRSLIAAGVFHFWSTLFSTGNLKLKGVWTQEEMDNGVARFYVTALSDAKHVAHLHMDPNNPVQAKQVGVLNGIWEKAQEYAANNPGFFKGNNPEFDKLVKGGADAAVLTEYLKGMKHSNPPFQRVEGQNEPYDVLKAMTKLFRPKEAGGEAGEVPELLKTSAAPSFFEDHEYCKLMVRDCYGDEVPDSLLYALAKNRINVPGYVHLDCNRTLKFGRNEPLKPRFYLSSVTFLATQEEMKRAIAGDSGEPMPFLTKPEKRQAEEEPDLFAKKPKVEEASDEELPM